MVGTDASWLVHTPILVVSWPLLCYCWAPCNDRLDTPGTRAQPNGGGTAPKHVVADTNTTRGRWEGPGAVIAPAGKSASSAAWG